METDTKSDLQQHVDDIAKTLQTGAEYEYCPECGVDTDGSVDCPKCETELGNMSAYDYLQDALDIQYIVTRDKQYLAARILVAFGGPNIWINTQTKTVEGYWWGDSAFASYYEDAMGVDEACEELCNC